MFPIIEIAGRPRERGRQYGAATAPLVRHSIASYARLFAHRRGIDWAAARAEAAGYQPLIADLAPHLLEEMAGIAEGAGLELGDILALNVRTELMAGVGLGVHHQGWEAAVGRNRAAGLPEHGECTTAAALPEATSGGDTLLAQTWDWTGDQRPACVLLRVRGGDGPDLLTITEAGMVAKIGLNSAGLAVSLNLLRSLADGREAGMPVHLLLRMMLEAGSFAEARAQADLARPAGSSCVTLVSGPDRRAVALELTPGGVAEVWPEGGLLAHANHCLDGAAAAGECPIDAASTSRERCGRARELLEAARGHVDVAALQAILRDHSGEPRCICRHPDMSLHPVDRGESVLGAVLEPGRGVIHVAPGVPCTVEFTPVAL